MHWEISKEFDFCYGHRVWSQELNSEYSLDPCLKCRHLHGHQGKVVVYLRSDKLQKGMVTDFNHLTWFKHFLDEVLDHKFIMDLNDPLFSTLVPDFTKDDLEYFEDGYYKIPQEKYKNLPTHLQELYESYVLVQFVPTSEELCTWLLKVVQKKMKKLDIEVSHIKFLETPKSKSTFYA